MIKSTLKVLLMFFFACPILYYGFDYVSFRMIGFPYAAGSYPFAEGFGFNCDYKVLKERIKHLRNNEEYRLPVDGMTDQKDEYFEHIYFYYEPEDLAFHCLINSACCNTSGLSLVGVAQLNTENDYFDFWSAVNNDDEVGWLENKRYLKVFREKIVAPLKAGLPESQ